MYVMPGVGSSGGRASGLSECLRDFTDLTGETSLVRFVFADYGVGVAVGAQVAFFNPNGAGSGVADRTHRVRNKEHRTGVFANGADPVF